MADEKRDPRDAAGPGKRRVVVRRRLGDAQMASGGHAMFIGDMSRSAGIELAEVDERDPRDVFEG